MDRQTDTMEAEARFEGGGAAGAVSTEQTEADLGISSLPCLRSPGGAGDLAWRLRVGVVMSDGHTNARGSSTRSDGVPEVLAGEAGLVAELFLDPGRGWHRWHSPGMCEDVFVVWIYLSSWLYLAKRSDRHGAPVLICESKEGSSF